MRYDISKASAPKMPNLGKGTKHPQNTSKKPQNTHSKPLFRCFSLYFTQIPLTQKSVSCPHLEGELCKMGCLQPKTTRKN